MNIMVTIYNILTLLIEIFLYLHVDYTTPKMLSPQGESIHSRKTGSRKRVQRV